MARRRPKIPRTTASDVPFALELSDWEHIERAYGQTFSCQLRGEVVKITKRFLYWASAEETPSLGDAQRRARTLRKFTASLLKEIQRNTAESSYTDELIQACFAHFWHKDTQHKSVAVRDALPPEVTQALSSFLSACDEALKQMKSLKSKTWMWRDGKAWDRWVVELSDLAEANGLPTASSISRPKLKPEKPSPFVRLVDQLQNCISENYQRSRHSLGALAEAIKRARRHTSGNTIAKD